MFSEHKLCTKEIVVLLIGLSLAIFLYVMKHPKKANHFSVVTKSIPEIGINKIPEEKTFFDPTTNRTVIEEILDIPAWKFNIEDVQQLTSQELITTIEKALEQEHYFEPEDQSALFHLINLKQLDKNNPKVSSISDVLAQRIEQQFQQAVEQNNEQQLTSAISRLKTLSPNDKNIKYFKTQLSTIKAINKIYKKGIQQIQDNLIITQDSQDAWHSAKEAININSSNSKAQSLINQVNEILVNNALRSAKEIDFHLAEQQIQQAQLLDPNSILVSDAQITINDLKQQRYVWLEQQINQAINDTNIQRTEKLLKQLGDLNLSQSLLDEYQSEISRMKLYGSYSPLDTLQDTTLNGKKLPQMVIMPVGSFIMGYDNGPKNEKPAHPININYGFAVSQKEISVAQFAVFINDTAYKTDAEKKHSSIIYDIRTGRLKNKSRINWKKDYIGKKSNTQNPVIHVSWNDANNYINWLSNQTGETYRLPSEAEFEYFLRAGSQSLYPWGNSDPVQATENLTGNLDRLKGNRHLRWKKGFKNYNDNYWGPAPTASFTKNQYNLYDTAGNVMEWTADCWHDTYTRAPTNGSSWVNKGCKNHVIRGGSWSSSKNEFRASRRFTAKADFTDARLGFRIVRDLK